MLKLLAIVFLCFSLFLPSTAEAGQHLKQKQQNRFANKHHLTRLKDWAQLEKFIKIKLLVLISDTDAYFLDSEMGEWDKKHQSLYHYARQGVKDFLDAKLDKCHADTGDVYKINSLVRTYAYQKLVRLHDPNGNGAIMGKKLWQQSAHLTGAAVDISWVGLSSKGRSCLRQQLRDSGKDGKIIYMRESDHYHVMVLSRK